jgi:hypothetical protein
MADCPPWIEWIDDDEATGDIGEIYRKWKAANPGRDHFPEILKCFGHDAAILQGVLDFCYPLQFNDGALSRRQKELIATLVSAINRCKY